MAAPYGFPDPPHELQLLDDEVGDEPEEESEDDVPSEKRVARKTNAKKPVKTSVRAGCSWKEARYSRQARLRRTEPW